MYVGVMIALGGKEPTQWWLQLPADKAGPKDRAGFILAPVNGI